MMDTSARLKACCDKLNEYITEYNVCSRDLKEAQIKAEEQFQKLKDYDATTKILQTLAGGLQVNVKGKIVSIVQKAIDATFPGMYFDMEFVTRRDKTECDLVCTDAEGNKQSILDGTGGGLKDIISLALRIAVWSLDKEASKVILLDEPLKYLSKGMRQQGADLLEVLSKDLGLQFIVVSHVDEIKSVGTNVYAVTKSNTGVSKAKHIDN